MKRCFPCLLVYNPLIYFCLSEVVKVIFQCAGINSKFAIGCNYRNNFYSTGRKNMAFIGRCRKHQFRFININSNNYLISFSILGLSLKFLSALWFIHYSHICPSTTVAQQPRFSGIELRPHTGNSLSKDFNQR